MTKLTMQVKFWEAGTKLLYVRRDEDGKLIMMSRVVVKGIRELTPVYKKEDVDVAREEVPEVIGFRARYIVKYCGKMRDTRSDIQKRRDAVKNVEREVFSVMPEDLCTLEQFINEFKKDLMEMESDEAEDIWVIGADEECEPELVQLEEEDDDLSPAEVDEKLGIKPKKKSKKERKAEREAYKSIHLNDGGKQAEAEEPIVYETEDEEVECRYRKRDC